MSRDDGREARVVNERHGMETNRKQSEDFLRRMEMSRNEPAQLIDSLRSLSLDERTGLILGLLEVIEDTRSWVEKRLLAAICLGIMIKRLDLGQVPEIEQRVHRLIDHPELLVAGGRTEAAADPNTGFLQSLLLLAFAAVNPEAACRKAEEWAQTHGNSELGRHAADFARRFKRPPEKGC
jgi:hypothetical protein